MVQALQVVAQGSVRGTPGEHGPAGDALCSGIGLVHILCNEAGITDEATLAAALLHHCLGQISSGYMDLRRRFGPLVADLVCELDERGAALLSDRPLLRTRVTGGASHRARMILLASAIMDLRRLGEERQDRAVSIDAACVNARVASLRGTHATLEVLFDQELVRLAAQA
jgi:(p)ppGpp synthase/HD superfamily hydrolase